MKQTSEPAVQPRRNVLTALWVWIVGLWGATELFASPTKPVKKRQAEITILVGRLCMDADFRKAYFAAKSDEVAITEAKSKGLVVERDDTKDAIRKMRAAHKSPNPIEDACAVVGDTLQKAAIRIPCNPWPC